MVTKILIILFFIVLALKPTYLLVECADGTIMGSTPLIMALFVKLRYFNSAFIISGKKYDNIYKEYFKGD